MKEKMLIQKIRNSLMIWKVEVLFWKELDAIPLIFKLNNFFFQFANFILGCNSQHLLIKIYNVFEQYI